MTAGPLWAALAASFVLAALGMDRRSGPLMLLSGFLGLVCSATAMVSIGRFVVFIPLLELAMGIGFLAKVRRPVLWTLAGVAAALYIAQLLML